MLAQESTNSSRPPDNLNYLRSMGALMKIVFSESITLWKGENSSMLLIISYKVAEGLGVVNGRSLYLLTSISAVWRIKVY
jgi:hypothetical protein